MNHIKNIALALVWLFIQGCHCLHVDNPVQLTNTEGATMSFKNESVKNIKGLQLNHIILNGSNADIGYQIGLIAKNNHSIKRPVKEVTVQNDYLKKMFPTHYDRMKGAAKAYGTTVDKGDFTLFGTVPGLTACSAVYYPPTITKSKNGYISRNLDFSIPAEISENSVFPFKTSYIVEMHPDKGYSSISLMCFEVFGLALEGINSEGLAVIHLADKDTAMNHPDTKTMKTVEGFNEFLPIQYLLDNCATAVEAREALKKMKHHHIMIPTHLMVADKSGDSFVFEYSPDGNKKVFVENSRTDPAPITNFQLNKLGNSEEMKAVKEHADFNGYNRFLKIDSLIDSAEGTFSENTIREINQAVYVDEPGEDDYGTTLFHCIYNLNAGTLDICLAPVLQTDEKEFHHFKLKELR